MMIPTSPGEYIEVGNILAVSLGGLSHRSSLDGRCGRQRLISTARAAPHRTLVRYRRANRQYVAMSRREVWQFLESQRRVYLGFAMDNGYPHVTPIWFVIVGERVYMRAQDYKVKVGLAAKGKACVVIDEGDKYRELRGAVMWGRSK